MERECANLLTESKRLKSELYMQEHRLKNVMGLVSVQHWTADESPLLTIISCRFSAV
jgi:hypothetical protein